MFIYFLSSQKTLKPKFKRIHTGELALNCSEDARKIRGAANSNKSCVTSEPCRSLSDIRKWALAEVKSLGGDVNDQTVVLGQYQVQFGLFKGKTFKWLVENGLGYAAWLVDNMRGEKATDAPLSKNKQAFKEYLTSFPEGKEAVGKKATEREKKRMQPTTSACSAAPKDKALASLVFDNRPPQALKAKVRRLLCPQRPQPNIPSLSGN